jgi:hypothetical protein
VALFLNSLVFQSDDRTKQLVETICGSLVAIAAMAPVYYTSYVKNATWDSTPSATRRRW